MDLKSNFEKLLGDLGEVAKPKRRIIANLRDLVVIAASNSYEEV